MDLPLTREQRAHMITLQAFFGLYLEGFLENDPVLRQTLWAVIKGDHWSMFCQLHQFIWSHKENVGVWQQEEGQLIICSNTPLHEDGYDDVVLYQGCTYWGLAATSSFPITLHQIFLCWWQDQLCTNDPCLPCWDFSPKDDKPHNTLRIHNGNWVVNKNKDVSFFAVGGDNALVSGGLVGITLNASGRTKFFS